jgi:hypothetical protein
LGLDRLPDHQVLEYAAQEHWIVVSHDVNSMTAAAAGLLTRGEPMHRLLLVHQRDPIASTI